MESSRKTGHKTRPEYPGSAPAAGTSVQEILRVESQAHFFGGLQQLHNAVEGLPVAVQRLITIS